MYANMRITVELSATLSGRYRAGKGRLRTISASGMPTNATTRSFLNNVNGSVFVRPAVADVAFVVWYRPRLWPTTRYPPCCSTSSFKLISIGTHGSQTTNDRHAARVAPRRNRRLETDRSAGELAAGSVTKHLR